MHIVLMDDDETLVRTLSRRLTQAGHRVDGFVHPITGQTLAALKADVYLLDLRFGSQSGLSFVAPLREQCPDSRILIMTGFASIATAVQAVKLGADDYLTKPIDFSLLLAAMTDPVANEPIAETAMVDALPVTGLLSTEQVAWEHIQRILQEQDGNISQTARLLGMHRRTLQRKLSKHRP